MSNEAVRLCNTELTRPSSFCNLPRIFSPPDSVACHPKPKSSMTHVQPAQPKGGEDATMEKDGSVRGPSRPELPIHRAVPNDDVLVGLPLVSGRVHAGQGVGRGAKSSTFPQHGNLKRGALVVESLDLEVSPDRGGNSEVPAQLESV